MPYEMAAWKAGVSDRIIYIWKKQGETDYNNDVDSPDSRFFQALKIAEAEYVSECMDVVNAGKADWTARMTVLERRHRTYFGKEAPKEEPQKEEEKKKLEPNELIEKLTALPTYMLEAILKQKNGKTDV